MVSRRIGKPWLVPYLRLTSTLVPSCDLLGSLAHLAFIFQLSALVFTSPVGIQPQLLIIFLPASSLVMEEAGMES